jgi:hypothetical protein
LKGFIKDRNNSSANLINGYAKVTLTRRIPERVRHRLLSRYARANVALRGTSFLISACDRVNNMVNSRPGTHRVNISLSRRNHTVVFEPENHCKPLWAFLAKNLISDFQKKLLAAKPPSDVHVIEISDVGKVALKLNGQNVRLDAWFKYDKWVNNDKFEEYAGQVKRIYVVAFGPSSRARKDVFLYMERRHSTMVVDGSDYDVDTSSTSKQDVIPVKSLTASLWSVSHSDPNLLPTIKRLLFVKEL